MPVYLTTATPGHDGTDTGAAWTDAVLRVIAPVSGAPGQRAAMLFFLPTRSNTTGIPGGPTILTPTTRVTQASIVLRVTARSGVGTLFLDVIQRPNGLPFSNTNLPRNLLPVNATLPSTGVPITALIIPPVNIGINANPSVIEGGHLSNGGGTLGIVLRAEASGVFTLDFADAEGGGLTIPRLTTTETSELDTGIRGPWLRSSRADRCAKSGIRALREDMVKDGFFEDQYVLPEWWDPPDPDRLPKREPVVREGVNED